MKLLLCMLCGLVAVRGDSCDEVPLYFKLEPGFSCAENYPGSTDEGPSTKSDLIEKKFEVSLSDTVCLVHVCAHQNGSTRFPYEWTDGITRFMFLGPYGISYKSHHLVPIPLESKPEVVMEGPIVIQV